MYNPILSHFTFFPGSRFTPNLSFPFFSREMTLTKPVFCIYRLWMCFTFEYRGVPVSNSRSQGGDHALEVNCNLSSGTN